MNAKRVIKIVYCGDATLREFDDRISIEFSPNELISLGSHFKEQALETEEYNRQTEMREMREAFDRAHDMWHAYIRRVKG